MGETYAAAGVSIEAGDEAVRRLAPLARSTFRPEVLADIGSFGSLVAVPSGYREPVLVSSTDGVGTKLLVAVATGRFDTIGIDLVAMCVDDVAVQGADPLLFLDYIATSPGRAGRRRGARGRHGRRLPPGRVRARRRRGGRAR